MTPLLAPRNVFVLVFLGCAGAMLFALFFLERFLGLAPCPLCVTQRLFMVLVGALALLAAVHGPGVLGRRIYASLCLLSAVAGGVVSGRHLWLQSLPEDRVPACGPGLDYLLETLPLFEAIGVIFRGDGNCAEEVWRFLGLTIPAQTLLVFAALAGISLWQLLRRPPG